METVRGILNNSVDFVNNNSVEVNSDNRNVPHILKVGSKKKDLQDIAISVHSLCEEKNIHLNCIWLPRAQNTKADTLSRMSDCDDWLIKQVVYEYFDEAWGKHTCDRFASSYNNKCEVFNSKYDCAETSGIDAFAQVWSNSVNWVVPPPRLIPKVVRKIEQEKCKCTSVISEWKHFFIFRLIFRSKGICKLIYKNKKVSYCAARNNILSLIKSVVGNVNIGLHSLRAGEANVAANSSLDERCLKRHGRWKSESAKDGYIVDSVEKRLRVSKSLGL